MAKVSGLMNLKGTVDGLSFYKNRYGQIAQQKGVIPKNKFKTEPQYAGFRNSSNEHAYCSRKSKQLREILGPICHQIEDKRLHNRLIQVFRKMLKGDGITKEKEFKPEMFRKMLGFQLNEAIGFRKLYPYGCDVERKEDEINVYFAAPENIITGPVGATHYRIYAAAVCWNLKSGAGRMESNIQNQLSISKPEGVAFNFRAIPGKDEVLLVFGGIVFGAQAGEHIYAYQNKRQLAMDLVWAG